MSPSDSPVPDEPVPALLRRAMRQRRAVRAQLGGQPVILWPYVLGRRAAVLHVLALVVGGGLTDEQWIRVGDLSRARTAKRGRWIPPGGNPEAALAYIEGVELICAEYRVRR